MSILHGIYALLLFGSMLLFLWSLCREDLFYCQNWWERTIWWILHVYMWTYIIGIFGLVALFIFEVGAHAR